MGAVLAHERGKHGERLAMILLQQKKYVKFETNVRTPYGEVDILCVKAKVLVGVEVKYRTSTGFGPPEAAINAAKLERLEQSMEWIVEQRGWTGEYQLDVIAITNINGNDQLVHLENVGE